MGESWKQKVGKRYRHHVQLKASNLTVANLFDTAEQVEKQYFGHLSANVEGLTFGTDINLFMYGKRCRPALAIGKEIIGYVEGESASDIQAQVREETSWPVLIRMKVVRREPKSDTVVITPAEKKANE